MDSRTVLPSSSRWGLPVAIVLAGAIVAGAVYFARSGQEYFPAAAPAGSEAVAGTNDGGGRVEISEHDPVLGNRAAPVTVVEFSDFECPFCRQFHHDTLPRLRERYIDSGQVQFVFKDFPLSQIHPHASLAAEAGQCARVQGKFWEYAESLFGSADTLTESRLLAQAATVGLATPRFQNCLRGHEQAATVAANVRAGIAAGVTGTPAFVINGRLLQGALPLTVFADAIEVELNTPTL